MDWFFLRYTHSSWVKTLIIHQSVFQDQLQSVKTPLNLLPDCRFSFLYLFSHFPNYVTQLQVSQSQKNIFVFLLKAVFFFLYRCSAIQSYFQDFQCFLKLWRIPYLKTCQLLLADQLILHWLTQFLFRNHKLLAYFLKFLLQSASYLL